MNNFEQRILRLLSYNDCVIVPGFGAFLAHNVPARYLFDEQIFMPPHRTLGFNPMVNADDALLVSDYINEGKLSYNEAQCTMQEDIKMLRDNLSNSGTLRFGTLGTLYMDINNNIVFEPDANGIDDPYNYGLETLSISRLQNKQEKTITIKRKDLGRYIAAAAAIVLTFLFVTPISDRAYENNLKASLSNFASSEHISMMQQLSTSLPEQIVAPEDCNICPITSLNATTANTVSTTIKEEPTIVSVKKESIASVEEIESFSDATTSERQHKHYIIVASSPNANNAQLAISELSVKMKADYIVVKCGKRHRVAVDTFESEQDALNTLPSIQKIFPDAWVLTY